ncbi:hypothetical protein PRIPAC_71726 [Pristionchus pacificus]|uniref:Uncharacterized protein n=1 Tax=Pristionchus pacificus TaxID=54126 RepID=A0A2A6C6G0_PRIPA|nr:hypothetical protein PRIPAC_71726 [Pristionchus pacificus]|eukprot:PDM73710.1 hypothetical protein PRIPAC_41066 [Pristionchus pacificus]
MDVKNPVKKADPIVEYIDNPKQISASGRCVIFFESVTDYEVMQHHKEGFKVYCISDAVTKEETVAYCHGLEQRFELVGDCLYGNLRFKESGEQMKKDDTAVADQKKPSIRGEKDSNKNSEEEDEDDLARLIFATFMSSLPEAPPGFPMQSRGKKSNPGRRFPKESKKSVVPSVEDEEEWHDEDTHGSFNPADPKCK